VIQRLDLDADGTMDTVRRFRKIAPGDIGSDYLSSLESVENNRNGSGVFSSAKLYRQDGSIVYSWDLDGTGIRDYYFIIEH